MNPTNQPEQEGTPAGHEADKLKLTPDQWRRALKQKLAPFAFAPMPMKLALLDRILTARLLSDQTSRPIKDRWLRDGLKISARQLKRRKNFGARVAREIPLILERLAAR